MPRPRTMQRILRVRELEEDQCRAALGATLARLKNLERAQETAKEREREGRRLVKEGAAKGDLIDRLAGCEEMESAQRQSVGLAARIAEAEHNLLTHRQELLAKRVERRQVEALIKKAREEDETVTKKQAQRVLDDWFLSRSR